MYVKNKNDGIDIGAAGGGAEELVDTQNPTLHLTAAIENDAVTGIRVGTVDLGSGINTIIGKMRGI